MKLNRAELLTRMIRRSGITKYELAKRMGISISTLRKYIANPQAMNGIKRKKLANALLVGITTIDQVANTPEFEAKKAESIIETIKIKQRHGNQTGESDSD